MKIINLLPVISYGDAVGNDALAIHDSLNRAGYESLVSASVIDPRVNETIVDPEKLKIDEDDIIIYHFSTGDPLNRKLAKMPGRKVLRYHNITPQEFYFGYYWEACNNCTVGSRDLHYLKDHTDHILAVSEFNMKDLRERGYEAPGEVLPILIPFSDYEKTPDEKVMKDLDDGRTNILFTGRIVTNKRQEQIIRAFYHYKKRYDDKARLILVGSYTGMEPYYDALKAYVEGMGLEDDVIITGHISFTSILAYYRKADLFLCMSDHEGFCVPLVESMFFEIPIIAKDTSAIAGTLGGTGILLKDDDPGRAAEEMHRVLSDEELRNEIIKKQKIRLRDFEHDKIEKQLLKAIEKIQTGEKNERDKCK